MNYIGVALYGEEVNTGEVGYFIRGRGHTVFVMMREGLCVRNEGMSAYVMVRGVVYASMRACEKDKR